MVRKNLVVSLTFTKDLLDRIDDYRYENRIPSRTEAVRRLLEKALQDCEKGSPKK